MICAFGCVLVAGGFAIIHLAHNMEKDSERFHSERRFCIQQKLNQILDNLYIQLIFSSLTEIDHLRKKSKNEKGNILNQEIEGFVKGIVDHLNNKKELIELKEEFEIIKNKLVTDSSIYSHIRDITKKILDIVQEHDEIKDDYDDAYDIELDISNTYLHSSLFLMVLGGSIITYSVLNCFISDIFIINNINMVLVIIVIVIAYMLVLSISSIRNRKKTLDELHKKILDIEQESLDISSINN